MKALAQRIREDRANRSAARGLFDANLQQVRADLEARGVGGRIADKAKSEVTEAMAQGLEIAAESKGVIAGTVAALALWFFRAPLIAALQGLFDREEPSPVQEATDNPPQSDAN